MAFMYRYYYINCQRNTTFNEYINYADYWLCEKLSNAVNMESNNISILAKFELVKA